MESGERRIDCRIEKKRGESGNDKESRRWWVVLTARADTRQIIRPRRPIVDVERVGGEKLGKPASRVEQEGKEARASELQKARIISV